MFGDKCHLLLLNCPVCIIKKQTASLVWCHSWLNPMHSSTASSGPALVGVIRKDWASQNSIALSWSQMEQPPSDIVDYEVKYYERVNSFIIQHEQLFERLPCSPFMHHICYLLSGYGGSYYSNFSAEMHHKWFRQRTITAQKAWCTADIPNPIWTVHNVLPSLLCLASSLIVNWRKILCFVLNIAVVMGFCKHMFVCQNLFLFITSGNLLFRSRSSWATHQHGPKPPVWL